MVELKFCVFQLLFSLFFFLKHFILQDCIVKVVIIIINRWKRIYTLNLQIL